MASIGACDLSCGGLSFRIIIPVLNYIYSSSFGIQGASVLASVC